ncbi:helix-turn-helix transcriptional regulator [Martelella alba]|nr:LuxR family transcriptional regulator [Martelella alba]
MMPITVKTVRNNMHSSFTDEINDIIHHELHSPEHIRFAYSVIDKQFLEAPVIFSNYPEKWIERYLHTTLYKYDPVITLALQRILPFSWGDNTGRGQHTTAKNIFIEAQKYNINAGFAFPLHDPENNLATLSLYSEGDFERFCHFIDDNKNHFHELLLYIHENFMEERRNNYNELRLKYKRKLTSREIETLQWASIGKTYSEIAIIMGITESTVKFHIGNLIAKLEVANAKHAIKKASDLHLLNYHD